MPAEKARAFMVPTPELQFEERQQSHPTEGATGKSITVRILQQRWVIAGTHFGEQLGDHNSEWRDVPCVRAK